jgi:glycosyltransferase involved in cell wall biosynthesis
MLSFAIVVPNLNQSHFLGSALESLRHQSSPFKLALMDGGSTDDFRKVIEPYSDIITFLRSESDAGQAAAIRDGADMVSGDIVTWLNADDYYFPGALDRAAASFEKDPELDVVYGDAVHVSSEGFFRSYFPAIQDFNHKDLTRSNFICQPACFVRRSAYEAVNGVDHRLEYTMDWDLWCRLAQAGVTFQYIHEVLAAVRYYPGTKTLSSSLKRYLEIYRHEKKYGKKLLPSSWLAYYYFDLKFKASKTLMEKAYFQTINLARVLKKGVQYVSKIKSTANETNYGFHRSKPIVHKHCTIHLPWYDKRQWSKLYLQVKPINDQYRILINDEPCSYVVSESNYLLIEVPPLTGPDRKITIENLQRDIWKLYNFWCDIV